jgi:hypothetical protein
MTNDKAHTLKDLRALNASLDNHDAALARTAPPPYSHAGDANRPANPVRSVGELIEWCQLEGTNPAPAVGHAMWSAVRMWSKGTADRAARAALTRQVIAASLRLQGKPDGSASPAEFRAAGTLSALWREAGQPMFDLAAADTQRHISGLKRAAARSAVKQERASG